MLHDVTSTIPFAFDVTGISAFEKSEGGQTSRRIGGLITLGSKDRAGEDVLQHGLDWSIFKQEGCFIDEHNGSVTATVGVADPESLKFYREGAKLPDGDAAPADGWWVEGDLFDDDPDAERIYRKAKGLEAHGRSLGFSVDGKVLLRTNGKKTIARAQVHDVAITRHPTHQDARLRLLAKSLEAARAGIPIHRDPIREVLAKALSAGESISMPEGPVSEAAGGGRVLAREDFGTTTPTRRRKKRRKLGKGDLAKALLDRLPWASAQQVGRFTDALWRTA